MFYVGLDIHDKRMAICVLSETGQVARRAQVRSIDEMMRALEALPDRFEVCHEASCGYGHYYDLLSPIAARVTVGARTVEVVAAFVDDPHRLRDAKAVGRYFGLVPSQDQSGDRNRLGHITREGPAVVGHLVAEATWQAVRRSPTVRAYFERVRRDDPQRTNVALVATAHDLVRVMWALLKRGTTWEEGAASADEPKGDAPAVAVV
jgi:hypothetical protein